MWEIIKDLVLSRNIGALLILVLMLLLTLRLITSTGRIIVYLIFIGALGACLYYFFPDFIAIVWELLKPYFQSI
jgi:hypothetical protein